LEVVRLDEEAEQEEAERVRRKREADDWYNTCKESWRKQDEAMRQNSQNAAGYYGSQPSYFHP